jgi:hypothetical protein
MQDPFDIDRIHDVPDPLAGIAECAMPPRRGATRDESPTRSRVAAVRATALGAALVYELAWLVVMHKRGDLYTIPRTTLLAEIAIPIAAAAVALAAAATPGAQGMGQPKARLTALALLSPALFVAATLVSSLGAAAEVDRDSFLLHCVRCFVWTSIYSAGPIVLSAWAFRRAFVAAPAWRSAALGLACGAMGAATMSLVCATGSPAHVLLGHGGMMLVAGVGGALLGRRFGRA